MSITMYRVRYVYWEATKYQSEKNHDVKWYHFHLIVRDFFRYICAKYDKRIFFAGGAINRKNLGWVPEHEQHERFERWKEGTTGVPLVDANMRELAATGKVYVHPISNLLEQASKQAIS